MTHLQYLLAVLYGWILGVITVIALVLIIRKKMGL